MTAARLASSSDFSFLVESYVSKKESKIGMVAAREERTHLCRAKDGAPADGEFADYLQGRKGSTTHGG
jgi:hypothetical protein